MKMKIEIEGSGESFLLTNYFPQSAFHKLLFFDFLFRKLLLRLKPAVKEETKLFKNLNA